MVPPDFDEVDLETLDDVIIGADGVYVAKPPKRNRGDNLVRALGVGILALGCCGLMLWSVPTRTCGATVSGRLRKMEKRMEGLVVIDEEAAVEDDVPEEPEQQIVP